MAKIEIKTLTDNCYLHCPEFRITWNTWYADDVCHNKFFQCKGLPYCTQILEAIKKSEGGDNDD